MKFKTPEDVRKLCGSLGLEVVGFDDGWAYLARRGVEYPYSVTYLENHNKVFFAETDFKGEYQHALGEIDFNTNKIEKLLPTATLVCGEFFE